MRGINQIIITAALTQDAELKYTSQGLAILTLDLGGVEHLNGRELPFYHRATVLGKYAEALMDSLKQGSLVMVTGRLNWRSWEGPEGEKRSAVDVGVDRVITLEGGELSYDARQQPRLVGATNDVLLAGNLTRDAETRQTQTKGVTRLGLAVNDPYYSGGETKERVGFYNVEAWDNVDLGMDPAGLPKSAPVVVRGRLKNSSWTDQQGNKRYSTEVEARSLMTVATAGGEGTERPAPKREAVAAGDQRESRLSAPSRAAGYGERDASRSTPASKPARSNFLDIDEEFPPEEDLPF